MRLVGSAFTVVIFGFTPGVAVAHKHAPTVKGQQHHHQHVGCNSIACERRVRAKRTGCYTMACVERVKTKQERRRIARYKRLWEQTPIPPQLEAIAACESGGDPRIVSPGGTYRGKYQFNFGTWREVGGKGDPAAAPEIEQDHRAAILYRKAGPRRWPVCGS